MALSAVTRQFIFLFLILFVCLLFSGCEVDLAKIKQENDDFVYRVLDEKWDQKFGLKTNYRIEDNKPERSEEQILEAIGPEGILTLSQAVSLATANNRQYQTEKELLYTKALDLRLVSHLYEYNPFLSVGSGYADSARETKVTTKEYREVVAPTVPPAPAGLTTDKVLSDINEDTDEIEFTRVGAESDVGFNRLLETGAVIGLRYSSAITKVLTGDVDGGFADLISATFRQPLLRGSERAIVLERLTQAERDVLYQIRSFNRFRKIFVVSVVSQYYRVVQLEDNLQSAAANYESLKEIHRKMEILTKAGKMPSHELEEAQQEKLDALDIYTRARREYEQALDEFKLSLAIPPKTEFKLDHSELNNLLTNPVSKLGIEEGEAIETAMRQRLDLMNLSDAIMDAERKIDVAEDNLEIELNLIARINENSNQREGFGTLLGIVATGQDVLRVGVEMDLPIDQVEEKNIYRRTLILLEQAKRFYEENTDLVELEVRTAYRNLIEAHERHLIHAEGYALAKQRLENVILLLQYSRANVRDVLRAQRDYFRARQEGTAALVDFTVALMEFYRDTGMLQVRPDGMWEKDQQPAEVASKD